MKGSYRIADHLIEIESLYETVHRLCASYRAAGAPEFTARMTREDLEQEKDRIRHLKSPEWAENPLEKRQEAYFEFTAVYRKIAEWMPGRDTFLMHGSAIAVDGAAYLFTAKSGTGKSTHARLWRELLGDRAVMVNDDKPLVKIADSGVTVYGTPWNGKHRLGENIAVPLKAVCFLEQAPSNRIRPLPKPEIYAPLMRQVYRPLDPAALAETMELVGKLADSVGFFRLSCNMEREAAEIAYRGMNGIEPN